MVTKVERQLTLSHRSHQSLGAILAEMCSPQCAVLMTFIRLFYIHLKRCLSMTPIAPYKTICTPCLTLCTNVWLHSALRLQVKLGGMTKRGAKLRPSSFHLLINECSLLLQ